MRNDFIVGFFSAYVDIPRSRDKKDSGCVRSTNSVNERLVKTTATITVIQDAHVSALGSPGTNPPITHLFGVDNGADRVCGVTGAGSVEKLEGHKTNGPINAYDADAIVASRANDPSHVRRVIFRRITAKHIAGVINEVDAMKVAGYWGKRSRRRIGPDVWLQILMIDINSLIDYTDNNTAAACVRIPGCGSADFCETEKRTKTRIVRRQVSMQYVVWLG